MLPPVKTSCFDHLTVENEIGSGMKCTAIRRQSNCKGFFWKRALSEESICYIGRVFQVLQTSNARMLAGKCYAIDHSSNAICSCHKAFAAVRTGSDRRKQHLEVNAA